MHPLKIKEIFLENYKINLNSGANYIWGGNGSRKTTLFRVLKYLLGASDRLENKAVFNNAKIKVIQDENEVFIDANEILYSRNYSKIYNLITHNVFIANTNIIAEAEKEEEYLRQFARNIIRESFFTYSIENSSYQIDTKLSLIGIDKSYERRIKRLINEINKKNEYKKESIELINEYNDKLFHKLVTSNTNIDKSNFESSAQSILFEYKNEAMKYVSLSDELTKNIRDIEAYNAEIEEKVFSNLESKYHEIISSIGLRNNSLRDAYFGKLPNASQSENAVYNLIARLVLQAMRDSTNGIGLMICDEPFYSSDKDIVFKIRNIIAKLCEDYGIQYIEFTNNVHGIDKNRIVYEFQNGLFL